MHGTLSGCDYCQHSDADEALERAKSLQREEIFYDEDHDKMYILRCPKCSQRYVWFFNETSFLESGDDYLSLYIFPIDAKEMKHLKACNAEVVAKSEIEIELERLFGDVYNSNSKIINRMKRAADEIMESGKKRKVLVSLPPDRPVWREM